jgi:hypothetical protein
MGQSLRMHSVFVVMVEDRDGIAGKDHADRQGDCQPETAFLYVRGVADLDIFAHFVFSICCLPVLCRLVECFAGTVPFRIFVVFRSFFEKCDGGLLVIIATLW